MKSLFGRRRHSDYKQRSFWQRLVVCGQEFCSETSIQGFGHIVAPDRHWTERLLWVGILAASLWGLATLTLGQLQRYKENPTVVTLERDFRSWSYSQPAVTACNENRADPTKMIVAIRSRWNATPEDEGFIRYQRFVEAVANSDLFHLESYQEFSGDDLDVDLKALALDVMPDAEVKASSSAGEASRWVPVMTEAGACYVTNLLAVADVALIKFSGNNSSQLPQTCKYSAKSCYIMFEVFQNVNFYVHSPYDVADVTASPSRTYVTLNRFTDLRVQETRSGEGVRQLTVRRRRCRYSDEPTDDTRQVFSTNTCRLACRSRLAQQLCGCTPFYYFYDGGVPCKVSGMRCLAAHAARLAAARCVCDQPCVEALYRELATDDQVWGRGPFQNKGSVRFTVQAPRTRLTRQIVFHFQDLVVSFGGAAGLFLGASFISFVEVFYFLLHRVLGLFALQNNETQVKKSRIAFEETRIRRLNSILEKQNTLYNNYY